MVLEQFQNDTADYADILLPATTFLEHTDLYFAYGHYHLQLARPACPSGRGAVERRDLPRCWPARMGFTDACFGETEDDMIRALLDSRTRSSNGITLKQLERERSVRLNIPEPFLPFAEGGFGTADGKCHFRAETLDYQPPVESRHGDRELRRNIRWN